MDGVQRWLEWRDVGLFGFTLTSPAVDAWVLPDVDDRAARRCFAREIEPILLQAHGWEALHASAVAGPDGAIAFCGTTGAGKSTTAYAMRARGFRQLADDHLVFSVDGSQPGGRPTIYPLSFEPNLRPKSVAHFESYEVHPTEGVEQEALPLAALVLLEQAPHLTAAVSITPVSPTRAFSEILPHAHAFDPADPAETERLTRSYLALVDQVPVFRVAYRPSFVVLDRLVDAIATLPELPKPSPVTEPRRR